MFSYKELKEISRPERPEIISGLLAAGTINLLVGDTGIGKTPLGLQLGLAVAEGTSFLDLDTEQGRVLFIDAESSWEQFREPMMRVGDFLGVAPEVPFYAYNRDWDEREVVPHSWEDLIDELLVKYRPTLVIIDPLRAFWPLAETKSDECMKMISWLRSRSRKHGITWVITHHVRKDSQDVDPRNKPDLLDDPQGWLQAAAGTRALVTSADTRIGVARPQKGGKGEDKDVALLMCGYARLRGTLAPMRLERVMPEAGDGDQPLGYKRFLSLEGISALDQQKLDLLPNTFKMSEVKELLKSSRYAYDLAKRWEGGGLVVKDHKRKLFHKAPPAGRG